MFVVQYRDTNLKFFIRESISAPDEFLYHDIRFAPDHPIVPQSPWLSGSDDDAWANFPVVLAAFGKCLRLDGRAAVEEETLPDL